MRDRDAGATEQHSVAPVPFFKILGLQSPAWLGGMIKLWLKENAFVTRWENIDPSANRKRHQHEHGDDRYERLSYG